MRFEILWPNQIWPLLKINGRVTVKKARKVGWGQGVV